MNSKEENQFFPLEENPETPEFFSNGSRPPSQTSLKQCIVESNKEIKNQNKNINQDDSLNSIFSKDKYFTFNEQQEYEGDRIIGPNFTLSKENFWLISKDSEKEKINTNDENEINKANNNNRKILIPNETNKNILDFKTGTIFENKKIERNKKNIRHFILIKNSKSNENDNQNSNEIIYNLNRLNFDNIKENMNEIINDNFLVSKKEDNEKFEQNEKNKLENTILIILT